MLKELSSKMQRAWLARAISGIQPNDQMHLPEPQAVLMQWTQDACLDKKTDPDHAYNLARYWAHGLRFPAHGPLCRTHLQMLLQEEHLCEAASRATQVLLAAEIQPLRIVRLWAFIDTIVPDDVIVPHLERLLTAPLPVGKKLKIGQIQPQHWKAWLNMQSKLTALAFATGLELHLRANLTSRQDLDPSARAKAAWEMLSGSESVLPLLTEPVELAELRIPRALSLILQYADSQTLRHLPWADIQVHFSGKPAALQRVWLHIFQHHKNLLLEIMPSIQKQYHTFIRADFLACHDYVLDQERCAALMPLLMRFPDWQVLFEEMLARKQGWHRFGDYLLGVQSPQSAPSPAQVSSALLSRFNATHWRYVLDGHRAPLNAHQLFTLWELVRAHRLTNLQAAPFLRQATMQATMQAFTGPTSRQKKPSLWDVSLGLPDFYASAMQVFMSESEQEQWLTDWTEGASADKMIVQVFKWFNPHINVPPFKELHLLTQAFGDNATLVDVLGHLNQKIDTIDMVELPNMLE